LTEVLVIALLALGLWFIADSLKAREAAHAAARKACEEAGVQFLDDTVSQTKLRLSRDQDGRAVLERWFRFEFSPSGDDREQGTVRLKSHRVQEINLGRLWVVR
jgi:hypothetical protein